MKLCPDCGQPVADEIGTCPSCGGHVGVGREYIDDYRILSVLHEGHSSILCRAQKAGTSMPVMIRLFTPRSAVDEQVAARLERELEELKALPVKNFVRHFEIKRSTEGLWYRVSEWVNARSWGDLLASGRLQDTRTALELFVRIAASLEILHQTGHIIPHLILDDIMVVEDSQADLDIRIDYKLSRFLDPRMDRPGPMLQRLLDCHPDILGQRPLDSRSDIWSLGKIFVELLSADLKACDFSDRIDRLALPQNAKVLFKVMLSDDRDMRPGSMAQVAESLQRILDRDEVDRQDALTAEEVREIRGLGKHLRRLAAVLAGLVVLAMVAWFTLDLGPEDTEAVLAGYAARYAPAVAFVVVDYRLLENDTVVYRNRSEGTAFLADAQGYLLTNRHVACPWLEDGTLFMIVNRFGQLQRSLRFDYRMHLWFEGAKAFQRLPDLSDSKHLADLYHLDSAFSSHKSPYLTIAGVANAPVKTGQLIRSPLRNDFAVLKIESPPAGLQPLPLDLQLDAGSVARLSPVITLGFPLGSRTQADSVNVSVTRGNVRRTFEELLQVDVSLHGGNSGGPLIDTRGKVVGLASGVAVRRSQGPLPMTTPLSDIGMVLPITPAVKFLRELKAGQTKWNGVLDLSVGDKLQRLTATAVAGRWAEAAALADQQLSQSTAPALVMAAATIHFCNHNRARAETLFARALSVDAGNNEARLMLAIIDWIDGRWDQSHPRRQLQALDWRSADEFFGYLVRVLDGRVDPQKALQSWETPAEHSWLNYLAGVMSDHSGDLAAAQRHLQQSLATAGTRDRVLLLSLAGLEAVSQHQLARMKDEGQRDRVREWAEKIQGSVRRDFDNRKALEDRVTALESKLRQPGLDQDQKIRILGQIQAERSADRTLAVRLAFCQAMQGHWPQALEYIRTFLALPGRESAHRLSLGLLEPLALQLLGRHKEARKALMDFRQRAGDTWYRAMTDCLLSRSPTRHLPPEIAASPANLLTAHMALGLWAESQTDAITAIVHYREALGSYLDHRLEYELARQRILHLREAEE